MNCSDKLDKYHPRLKLSKDPFIIYLQFYNAEYSRILTSREFPYWKYLPYFSKFEIKGITNHTLNYTITQNDKADTFIAKFENLTSLVGRATITYTCYADILNYQLKNLSYTFDSEYISTAIIMLEYYPNELKEQELQSLAASFFPTCISFYYLHQIIKELSLLVGTILEIALM